MVKVLEMVVKEMFKTGKGACACACGVVGKLGSHVGRIRHLSALEWSYRVAILWAFTAT